MTKMNTNITKETIFRIL